MKSRGVHTNDNFLLPFSSHSSLTELEDVEAAMRRPHETNSVDADHSSFVSTTLDEVNFRPKISESTTTSEEVNAYKLTVMSRKSYCLPIKLELNQLSRRQLQRKRHNSHQKSRQRTRRCCQHDCHCAFDQEHQAKHASVPTVPSQTAVQHTAAEVKESYQSSQDFQHQPRGFWSKVQNMFKSWFRAKERNDDVENWLDDTENAKYYVFDHGSPTHFQTTDCPPHLFTERITLRTEAYGTKLWAELFGVVNIGVSFFITFFIQFYRFILYSILNAIIVGLLKTTSDYLLKPFLALVFNGFLQPSFTFAQNIFQSICNMAEPLTNLLGNLLKPFAEFVRAFRIVEIKNINNENREHQASQQRHASHQNIA